MGNYLYLTIYEDILSDIKNKVYSPNTKIPTEKLLSEKYNVSRITSRKALSKLYEEGLIVRHAGIGSFVNYNFETQNSGKKNKCIGFVLEAIWPSYGIQLFNGIYDYAYELGYTVIIKKTDGEQVKEIAAIDELISMGASGILIEPVHGTYYNKKILELVLKKYPFVFIDRFLTGIPAPYACSDNIESAIQAVDFFVKNNHKHIAFVTTGKEEASSLIERKLGYMQGLKKNGLSENYCFHDVPCISSLTWDTDKINQSTKSLENFLQENSLITAAVASENELALLLKRAALNIGKKIPDDLEIICYDSPQNHFDDYEFTHIRQNEYEMGTEAVKVLQKLINNEKIDNCQIAIPSTLIEGASTK